MKQFLRYQISGMVFIGWLIIFHAANYPGGFFEGLKIITLQQENFVLGGFLSALPIGVLVHQFSVLLKNWILARKFKCFSDHPRFFNLQSLDGKDSEQAKYILERISNLNSFYYVRFDNGVLAPLLSLFVICLFGVVEFNLLNTSLAFIIVFFISFSTVIYIFRVKEELEFYFSILDRLDRESKR